jgi:hypothetical protein
VACSADGDHRAVLHDEVLDDRWRRGGQRGGDEFDSAAKMLLRYEARVEEARMALLTDQLDEHPFVKVTQDWA